MSDSFWSFAFSFSWVSVCVWDPNKLFDGGNSHCVGKRTFGGGGCYGKVWLDDCGGGGVVVIPNWKEKITVVVVEV